MWAAAAERTDVPYVQGQTFTGVWLVNRVNHYFQQVLTGCLAGPAGAARRQERESCSVPYWRWQTVWAYSRSQWNWISAETRRESGRVNSERRCFLQPRCKGQKHLAGFCSGRGNSRLKEIVPGLKLYYGLYNSKRPEVISRVMRGQLNFLPLRPCNYFSFSGPHQPEQLAKTNL